MKIIGRFLTIGLSGVRGSRVHPGGCCRVADLLPNFVTYFFRGGYSFAIVAIAVYAAVVRSTQAPVTKSGRATP